MGAGIVNDARPGPREGVALEFATVCVVTLFDDRPTEHVQIN